MVKDSRKAQGPRGGATGKPARGRRNPAPSGPRPLPGPGSPADAKSLSDAAASEPEPRYRIEALYRILPFLKPYKGRIVFGLVTNGFARLFDLLPLLVVAFIVDTINQQGTDFFATTQLAWYGAAIFGTFVGLAFFQSVSDYAWDTLAQKVRHDLRMKLYAHLQSLDVAYFEDRQTGDIMSVLSSDVDNLENFLADATTSIVRLIITFVGTYALLAWLDWHLALLLFAPLPIGILVVRVFVRRIQPEYRRSRKAVGDMNALLENNLQGIPVIQAYTAEEHQKARMLERSAEYRDAAVRAAVIRTRFIPWVYVIAGLSFALLIAVGGWMTFAGWGPSLGDYVAFILFAMRLIMPLFILGFLLNQFQRSEASARRIMELLDAKATIRDEPGAVPLDAPPRQLEFRDVHFAYPRRENVLHGVDFKVRRGQVLGIVGPTGAGKSTIVKLLLRYYDPTAGDVQVDGKPLRNHTLASLRKHIGYVSQDAFLFSGTVAENIRLGSPDATQADVEEAARVAGAAEFIEQLPKAYETLIGERGLKLSGGQRQRISLARAVLRDPAILLLDEATSAVDTRTEELIQRNLHAFRAGRITVAVAHRLSTVRQSDEILVLVDGVVVERGSHNALVRKGGVYADLWRVQSGEANPRKAPGAATGRTASKARAA
jgi:ATP-binding cassette, subfamily B, bacterial